MLEVSLADQDFFDAEPAPDKDRVLVFALVIVFTLHSAAIMLIRWDLPTVTAESVTLKIKLLKQKAVTEEKPVIKPVRPLEQTLATRPIPASHQSRQTTSAPDQTSQSDALSHETLNEQIKSIAREITTREKPRTRTFSTSDFPAPRSSKTKESAPEVARFAAQTSVSTQNAQGQYTNLIRNSRGDESCWQQRGIPGGQTSWYRVPVALCGHLQ